MRWTSYTGARQVRIRSGEFEITWDPARGWILWQGNQCLGFFGTVSEAKAFAEKEAQ